MAASTKCKQMGCKCHSYVENPSKWSKGKCKSCNHSSKMHGVESRSNRQRAATISTDINISNSLNKRNNTFKTRPKSKSVTEITYGASNTHTTSRKSDELIRNYWKRPICNKQKDQEIITKSSVTQKFMTADKEQTKQHGQHTIDSSVYDEKSEELEHYKNTTSMSWYYFDAQRATKGPLSIDQLKPLYGSQIKDNTYIWNGTTVPQWTALNKVPAVWRQLKQSYVKSSRVHSISKVDDEQRSSWKVGNKVEIYSETQGKWQRGEIVRIYNDDEGEWLDVKYGFRSLKEIGRFNKYIRPIQQQKIKQQTKGRRDNKQSRHQRQKNKTVMAIADKLIIDPRITGGVPPSLRKKRQERKEKEHELPQQQFSRPTISPSARKEKSKKKTIIIPNEHTETEHLRKGVNRKILGFNIGDELYVQYRKQYYRAKVIEKFEDRKGTRIKVEYIGHPFIFFNKEKLRLNSPRLRTKEQIIKMMQQNQ